MRFVTREGWAPFHGAQTVEVQGRKVLLHFRSEDDCRVYVAGDPEFADEVLAAVGCGDLEVEVIDYGPVHVRVVSEGRVWLRAAEIEQRTLPAYGTVFTEPMPDRQVSPEFRRIQLLLKETELKRRQENDEFRRRLAEIEGRNGSRGDRPRRISREAVEVPQRSGDAQDEPGDLDLGSAEDVEKPRRGRGSRRPVDASVPKLRASGEVGVQGDAEGVEAGDPADD